MTATREQAIQHAIEVFFGRRSLGNVSYGDLRKRLEGLEDSRKIDRNTAAALLEESPQALTKLLAIKPPPSPFKPGKPEKTTVGKAIEWHDALIRMRKAKKRTGTRWAQPSTSILRSRAKLPITIERRGENTIIYGLTLSDSEIHLILEGRGMVQWMTLRDAIEHPRWDKPNDRLLWAIAYAQYEQEQLDKLVSDAQHAVLTESTPESTRLRPRRPI